MKQALAVAGGRRTVFRRQSHPARRRSEVLDDVIILSSGYESRNENWALARAEYDISTGIKTKADMDAVIAFFYARGQSSRLPV
jgi:uncharacterized protein (TIGR02217 family)